MKTKQGFSLFELIIALVIVASLAAISVSAYRGYILKSHRSDALHTLLAMQLAQEKYRMNNTTYGTLAQVWNSVTTTEGGYYSLAISGNTATAYTITATAVGTQANDEEDGTSCSTLTLAYSNGTTTKSPAACWLN